MNAWVSLLPWPSLTSTLTSYTPSCLEVTSHSMRPDCGSIVGLRLYGLSPSEYHARGIRIAGRTAIECCIDPQALTIARTVREVVRARFGAGRVGVVDLFAGSGNLMFQVSRLLAADWCVGLEMDPLVCALSRANLAILGHPATLECGSFQELLTPELVPADDGLIVAIVAPPWGRAFSFEHGLDLRLTTPPVRDTLELLAARFPASTIVAVVQTHDKMAMDSFAELIAGREVHFSGIDETTGGRNKGYLICSV